MPSYAEWTAAQTSATVSVDGHELDVAYYDEGSSDPVVFLHGIPTNSFLWRDVIPPIAAERRVIVPDMLGYGNSSMFDGFDRSIRAQEEMITGLLSALDVRSPSLVGHDLGGGVLLRYAAHNPGAVDELVLSNSIAYDSWPIQLITDLGLPETARETDVEELQAMLDDLFRETLYGNEHSETFLDGMTAPWNSEAGVTSLVRNAVSTNTNHTTEIDPRSITARTLLLWGAADQFQPIEWAERLQEDIGTADVIGLDGANHWVMEDRPDAYRDELADFLL
ncbi:alpha/beta fold hydrolase [Haloplanus litoreus]|uniref:Alpha/beta fold hydrolase n=1 Tax=Haloplanus litoreus TaxID=767515 RepID=A0ABD5ZWS6_9EURY